MKLFSKKQHRAGGPGPIAQYIERAYIYTVPIGPTYDHDTSTSRRDGRKDGQTDEQTTCRSNTALCVASLGKNEKPGYR